MNRKLGWILGFSRRSTWAASYGFDRSTRPVHLL